MLCSKCGSENDSGNHYYCKACNAASARQWRLRNQEKVRQYRIETKESRLSAQKIYDTQKRAKKSTTENTVMVRKWRQRNPSKHLQNVVKREADKLKATPSWAIEFFIEEAYMLAVLRSKSTGIKHHVDHVIPLRSRIVCGLHAHTNLRVIPAEENIRKSNKLLHE